MATNQSSVSGGIWTNESAPLCSLTLTKLCLRLESLLASGNVSTVTRLRTIYSNLSSVLSVQSDSVISPIIWIQEVITPIMISLSGLVLGIAALILVLLVKHYRQYRHETQPPAHFQHHQHHHHHQPTGNIFF